MSSGGCDIGNEYDGRLGTRISSIFVIFVASALGACLPIFAATRKGITALECASFFAKYFGSGVIVATAFIHVS